MSASQPADLTLDRASKILKSYDDSIQLSNIEPLAELDELRNSLRLIASLSSSQNLGICADNFRQGFSALTSYLKAFGYQGNLEQDKENQSNEPVYLKFSTQKMSYYSSEYTGEYRGVLVSYQSEDDLIAGTYGHFPLDLFLNN
ncbi:DUF1824 family protein [Waterburya agarophytonicola K14]|uniref:DUF1824 family protein n=1 Tax=Waterburya agarophytonicola KI4 TaxID=2874699 RepID=A0A964BTH0_9CYAN|nr:DUF1824 family protein [Waterburya agarophytonicola]MCC0179190.1 DUF1824 family protein [Waterburya agarophytonicola KI4]